MGAWRADDLDELEDETLRTGNHAATAARLTRLAAEGEFADVTRAEILVRAGGQWQLAGEAAQAADLYQQAVDDGGRTHGDARAYLADALFDLDDPDQARTLLGQVRADEPRDPAVYHVVAEMLEAQRDLSGAHDWATEGVQLVLRGEQPSHVALDMLLRTRFRVRRDMGLLEDGYDDMLDSLSLDDNSRP